MFGVLVDVSGSMKSAYAVDRSSVDELNVERTHAVLTTTMNIVKREVVEQERRESIFVCAFGLSGRTVTCDLISLLEYIAGPTDSRGIDGHRALIDLMKQHRAPQAEPWIKDNLSQLAARILYEGLKSDASLIPKLIEFIGPSHAQLQKGLLGSLLSSLSISSFTNEIIEKALQRIQRPKPRPVQYVAEMLDGLLLNKASGAAAASSSSESLHDRIQESIKPIRPYIYGLTPMCKALEDAASVFNETNVGSKVLFILSDGVSTDGDPRPIAERLHRLGVTIVTCFLTSDHIDDPRRLLDKADPTWRERPEDDGRSVLFEMSSTMKNTDAPLPRLTDENWKLPKSGVSRLFIQVNSLDVVNEFCKVAVSQMTTLDLLH